MKLKEIRKKLDEMTDQELEAAERNYIEELFHLRFQMVTGHLDDSTKVRQLKKNIARVKTIILERQDNTFWKKRSLEEPKGAKR